MRSKYLFKLKILLITEENFVFILIYVLIERLFNLK